MDIGEREGPDMELTKKEKIALSSALKRIKPEIEAKRELLESLYEQGIPLSAEEIVSENRGFSRLSLQFIRLETRYLELLEEWYLELLEEWYL